MTKLLEKAIERARALPDDVQDAVALALMAMTDTSEKPEELDEETRTAIRQGLDDARRGDFATAEEMAALWRRFGA
jgi:hypothetical protein